MIILVNEQRNNVYTIDCSVTHRCVAKRKKEEEKYERAT